MCAFTWVVSENGCLAHAQIYPGTEAMTELGAGRADAFKTEVLWGYI